MKMLHVEELKPLLEGVAKSKDLNLYHYTNDELQKDFKFIKKDIDVLVLSKTPESARFNLLNQRHSYMVTTKKQHDVCDKIEDNS